jgi:predicted amidophosphoribosyltransferase
VLIPVLIIVVGAVMTVILGLVVAVTRRRRQMMPPTGLICPRCRSAVNPHDAVCRTCGTPLYRPYRFYRPTR